MSRVLSDLLGAKEPAFTFALERLESMSGHPNVDVRLVTDVEQTAKSKLRQLGLDPNDSTEQEVFHSLQALTKKHDEFLASAVGGEDPTDTQDLLPRLKARVESLPLPKRAWAIKHSVAKRLLKDHPPRNVMRVLGYKSVDSMLKREKIDELYGACRFVETPQWYARFTRAYKKLRPSDFEPRDITIIDYSFERWHSAAHSYTAQARQNIVTIPELASVGVLPLPQQHMKGISITLLPLLVQQMYEIRVYSAFFKLQQVKPVFGEIIAHTLAGKDTHVATIGGQPVPWQVLHRFMGRYHPKDLPAAFDPHLQLDDLVWQTAEEILYTIEPALKFWEGTGHIGWSKQGQPVSFHLLDNAVNYCNGFSFEHRTLMHFRSSLWHELLERYLSQKAFTDQVLRNLDEELVSPEASLVLSGVS